MMWRKWFFFWWRLVRISNDIGWWKALFLHYDISCQHLICLVHLVRLLFSTAGLLLAAPSPRQQFFILQLTTFGMLFQWICNMTDIIGFFENILFIFCGEGEMWVTPILFYETNLLKKWKEFYFYMIKGEKGGKGEAIQHNTFFHLHCISFGVRIIIFNLGINDEFAIAYLFSFIFTSCGGINIDVLICKNIPRSYFFVHGLEDKSTYVSWIDLCKST